METQNTQTKLKEWIEENKEMINLVILDYQLFQKSKRITEEDLQTKYEEGYKAVEENMEENK